MDYINRKRKILKEVMATVLDDSYYIGTIDNSECLIKDLNNGVDFEIEYGKGKFDIYVWKNNKGINAKLFHYRSALHRTPVEI